MNDLCSIWWNMSQGNNDIVDLEIDSITTAEEHIILIIFFISPDINHFYTVYQSRY